jgi:hypothetical protein
MFVLHSGSTRFNTVQSGKEIKLFREISNIFPYFPYHFFKKEIKALKALVSIEDRSGERLKNNVVSSGEISCMS